MTAVHIIAYGRPAPQGSKSFKGMAGGHAIMAESSRELRPWREAVKQAALESMGYVRPAVTLAGPVVIRMVFTVPKPKSAPKTRRTWPDKRPDLSKLCRAVEDALVDAGVIADDARIVEYDRLAKVYPGEDPDALHIPGVRISVWEMGADNPFEFDSRGLADWERELLMQHQGTAHEGDTADG